MPVEIKELIIRAIADKSADADRAPAGLTGPSVDQEAIIRACVKQVMRIMKKSRER